MSTQVPPEDLAKAGHVHGRSGGAREASVAAPLAWERLKDLLLLVPGIHLLICFTYLFFYYTSFGGGIPLFSSPADVFSVSMQEVAPSYISLGVGMGLAYLMFYDPKRGNVYFRDTLSDGDYNRSRARVYIFIAKAALGGLVALLVMLQAAYLYVAGVPEYSNLQTLVQLLVLIGSLWIGSALSLKKAYTDAIMVCGLVISAVVISGIKDGHYDRSLSYQEHAQTGPRCRAAVVLRNVANLYLAALPDETRVLIDEDCEVKFQLRSRNAFHPLPRGSPFEIIQRGRTTAQKDASSGRAFIGVQRV